MASVIKVEHVTKKFGGETVLEDICLRFRKGAIYGLSLIHIWNLRR